MRQPTLEEVERMIREVDTTAPEAGETYTQRELNLLQKIQEKDIEIASTRATLIQMYGLYMSLEQMTNDILARKENGHEND